MSTVPKKEKKDLNSNRKINQFNYTENSQNKSSEEQFLLNLLKQISSRLKTEHNYFDEHLLEAYSEKEKGIMIPVSIFSSKLCPSETLTKYLKEEHDLNYHEISVLINRNERGIWANYQRAIKKIPSKLPITDSFSVPATIFQNNKLSILECLVSHLKDFHNFKNSKIAKLLNKNSANIWTIYNRGKLKEIKK